MTNLTVDSSTKFNQVGYSIESTWYTESLEASLHDNLHTPLQLEYLGLLSALNKCLELELTELNISLDSQVLVLQILGKSKIHSKQLRILNQECLVVLGKFKMWTIKWIPREKNKLADKLSKTK